MSRILAVDDEERVLAFLSRYLGGEGHHVLTAGNGRSALDVLDREDVDLVLLDLVMPRVSGLQVLASLRTKGDSPPVIVLSAVSDVGARVQALDRGAVDFVSKPFHMVELDARIRRHLSTVPRPQPGGGADHRYLAAGGVRLDLDRRRVRIDGREVVLSPREFSLLAHLMRRRGEVCRREELLHDVWGLDLDPESNVVEACMRRLRYKLTDPPIETVRGVGYCFHEV
ncbi:response regulator transcription factor [Nocardioides sp.]|uniref:response regulator transcription factor n=1 Tax=Nocardioides sp. TaxID=35761 RepID=UPI00286DA498|nr:response regulator transcription factor [Nocardioides sp.]